MVMMMRTIHIQSSSIEVFDKYASIDEIYGQNCSYRTKFGVSGLSVLIDVSVKTNNHAKYYFEREEQSLLFHCRYSNVNREDNTRVYKGFDMDDSYFGEQKELFKWLKNVDFHSDKVYFNDIQVKSLDEVKEKLIVLAENKAVDYFKENIVDILTFDDIQEKIIDEFKKYKQIHLLNENQIRQIIDEECQNIIKNEYCKTIDDGNDISIDVTENDVFFDLVNKALKVAKEEINKIKEQEKEKI